MTQNLIRRLPFRRFPESLFAGPGALDFPFGFLDHEPGGELRPSLNLHETTDAFLVQAELPGVSEKDLKVELKKNVLTISGELRRSKPEEGQSRLVELREGNFLRAMALPAPVQAEQVRATMKNGILEIRLPKVEPELDVRVIPVAGEIQNDT